MRKKPTDSWVRVTQNPPGWTFPYSVEVKDQSTWGIFSQHRLLRSARANAVRAAGRYQSGHEALTTPSYSRLSRKRKKAARRRAM
jgi:hypothetical protein